MRKKLQREADGPEPSPLPDLSRNLPALSFYSLVVTPRHPQGHPTWDGATLIALADGRRMPAVWMEYRGERFPGQSVHDAWAFAGYVDVLADIACDAPETPKEYSLYDVNDDGDYRADEVIVQRVGDDLVWLTNAVRFPSRVRFNRDQFGATVLAGVRRALELGVATQCASYDPNRTHLEADFRYAEQKLAPRFGHLRPPVIYSELPTNAPMFDPDTPDWLRLHRDFPPTGDTYGEFFPEFEGMATPESAYVSRRILDALKPHLRKRIPGWDCTDRPLPPVELHLMADSLDALHHGAPRWNGAWVLFWDSRFNLPDDGITAADVVRSRLSLLVRELSAYFRKFSKAGRPLHLLCDV